MTNYFFPALLLSWFLFSCLLFSGCGRTSGEEATKLIASGGEIQKPAQQPVELVVNGQKLTPEAFQAKKAELVQKFNETVPMDGKNDGTKVLMIQDVFALIDVINAEAAQGKIFTDVATFGDLVNQL